MEKAHRLIQNILSGEMAAFRELIQTYERLVVHIITPLVTVETDRQDVCQDVFIKVYQNLGQFKFKSSLGTWIGRIAYNTGVNYARKKKVPLFDDFQMGNDLTDDSANLAHIVSSADPDPEQLIESADRNHYIRQQIEKLPVLFRTIVTLYHLEQMSYTDISEILNLPEGTVKSYLFRGRKKLKELLMAEFAGEKQ
ncbi:MAG: sigma-70 family RNA polymerase sigma factor [Calditrichales bacterium]|nr:MAG: sigma-70 family RNA polymerase sigma factor [Calditrichales bacterium]